MVSSRIEIPILGLVSGNWMSESSFYSAGAGMHIWRLQLACSSWLKVAQHGIYLSAIWI